MVTAAKLAVVAPSITAAKRILFFNIASFVVRFSEGGVCTAINSQSIVRILNTSLTQMEQKGRRSRERLLLVH